MLEYYGLDWAAALLTFAAIWMLGNQSRLGFVLMIAGNAFWIGTGLLGNSWGLMVANLAFIALNVRGLIRWSRGDKQGPEASEGASRQSG